MKLVGTRTGNIIEQANLLLDDPSAYAKMAFANNPYGDGSAARRIAALLVDPGDQAAND